MVTRIPLTQGLVALVDDEDAPALLGRSWHTARRRSRIYAVHASSGKLGARRCVFMHRVILDAPETSIVDHINGDCLDNRRVNLRLCSIAENARNVLARANNKSGFKGVDAFRGRFRATIGINGAKRFIGHFDTAEDAAHAYDEAATRLFGAFACLNFPNEIGQRVAARLADTNPTPSDLTRHPPSLRHVRSIHERQDEEVERQ